MANVGASSGALGFDQVMEALEECVSHELHSSLVGASWPLIRGQEDVLSSAAFDSLLAAEVQLHVTRLRVVAAVEASRNRLMLCEEQLEDARRAHVKQLIEAQKEFAQFTLSRAELKSKVDDGLWCKQEMKDETNSTAIEPVAQVDHLVHQQQREHCSSAVRAFRELQPPQLKSHVAKEFKFHEPQPRRDREARIVDDATFVKSSTLDVGEEESMPRMILTSPANGSITDWGDRSRPPASLNSFPPIPQPNFDETDSFDSVPVTAVLRPRYEKSEFLEPPPPPQLRSAAITWGLEEKPHRPQLSTPLRQYHRRSISQNQSIAGESSFIFNRADLSGPPRLEAFTMQEYHSLSQAVRENLTLALMNECVAVVNRFLMSTDSVELKRKTLQHILAGMLDQKQIASFQHALAECRKLVQH